MWHVSLLSACIAAMSLQSVALASDAATTPIQDEAGWRKDIRELARGNLKHPAWGYEHALRDYALARALAAADGVRLDDDVLFAAAMLHDIAAFERWAADDVDHADRAAALVPEMLTEAGLPEAKIGPVQAAIRTHMYDRTPDQAEARYLHDADALDWLGAIGAARILALVDTNGGQPNTATAIGMLRHNLNAASKAAVTPAGRAALPGRRDYLESFIATLEREAGTSLQQN